MTTPKTPEELAKEFYPGHHTLFVDTHSQPFLHADETSEFEQIKPKKGHKTYSVPNQVLHYAFLAGYNACLSTFQDQLRAARKEGFEAAREMGRPTEITITRQDGTEKGIGKDWLKTKYETFEDWEREQEKK